MSPEGRPCTHLEAVATINHPPARECKHARSSGHPVVASAEEGERCLYCYPDDAFTEY